MRRRALLAATSAVLAGCTGTLRESSMGGQPPAASLTMTATTDAELPHRVLYSVRDGESRRGDLLAGVRETGEGTIETTGDPPLPVDRPVAGPDRVYDLRVEVTDRTAATSYRVTVNPVQGTVVEADAVAFADLPAVDREKFESAGLADGETLGVGTGFLYTDAERRRSALVPDPEYDYITWENGNRARWVVDGGDETTLKTYRYSVEETTLLADYGAEMRARFAFGLSGLSVAEREVVQTATAEGRYVVDHDESPPAFESLVDRFRGRPTARALHESTPTSDRSGASGAYLVRYDGDVYWTRLRVRTETSETAAGIGQ